VCDANVNTDLIEKHWDTLVHLAASVMSGNASAAADIGTDSGLQPKANRYMRPAFSWAACCEQPFLADYFVKAPFRQELRRVLNRGEAVNCT
jgi:TnpA family transposase